MTQNFINAVNERDLTNVRFSLSNEMLLDPRGKVFNEMLAYAEQHLTDLYEPHDGGELNTNQAAWNEDTMYAAKNVLDRNFSKAHLDNYVAMVKVVLKEKTALLNKQEDRRNFQTTEQSHLHTIRTVGRKSNKRMYVGVAVGGAVLAIAGLCVEKVALAATISSVGVAGIIIGGLLYVKEGRQ